MKTSRRDFIKSTGYVAIGFSILPGISWIPDDDCSMSEVSQIAGEPLKDWLQVLEDGRVRIYTGKMELGQGLQIAIAQVAAEELNMDVDQVEIQLADTGLTPNEGYTAGSRSIETSAMSVRKAAAAAGAILIEKAAEKYTVEKASLFLEKGFVRSKGGEVNVSFAGILEGEQIETDVPQEVVYKAKEEYKLVGMPVPRSDIKRMLNGEAVYVQDLRFKNTLHARIVRPAAYDAVLTSLNATNAEALDDAVKVFRKNNFVAVVAPEEFLAEKAQVILKNDISWQVNTKLPTEKDLVKFIKSLPSDAEKVEEKGSVELTANSFRATYSKPYIMHASVGPSCAVAFFDGDSLQVWSHTQGVFPLRDTLSELLKLPKDKIRITGVPGSGCYGHNGADDVAAEAAILALEFPNKHLRLQWSREDEHAWEPYGSAMLMELQAELDNNGELAYWKHDVYTDTHSTRPGGNKVNLLPTAYYEGVPHKASSSFSAGGYRNSIPYYSIPNMRIDAHKFRGPLRVSALRGLGAYGNIFAIESFMDELAEIAGKDPVAFRLMHLEDPRAKEVLLKVKEMTSGVQVDSGEGLGYAFSRYKNSASYFATAARVRVDEDGKVQVVEMWGAIDSGEVINPNGLINQTEGGMIQSASWTLKEQVTYDETHIDSIDWNGYPIIRFKEVPLVHVEIISRPTQPPLGAGEAAQGPAAAAIVNAVYQATGTRVRNLPVNLPKTI